MSGIPDPLRQLPDMAALLDVAEVMITENMEKEALEKFHYSMYRPEPGEIPVDFEPDDQLDAFAAFEQAAGSFQ